MNFYRSVLGGSAADNESYTFLVNNQPQMSKLQSYFPDYFNKRDTLNNYYNFNQKVIVGDMVDDCSYMLEGARSFNSEINFGLNVKYLSATLRYCSNFNRNINIPYRAISVYYMLGNCFNFNSYVNFMGNNVTDLSGMFANCYPFNKPIIIPDSATRLTNTFYNTAYNQTTYIPANVIRCNEMFAECLYMTRNIYFNQASMNNVLLNGMLYNRQTAQAINLFTNTPMGAYTQYNNLISNSTPLTWTSVTNGYYNNAYNIYVYYNYSAN